MEENDQADDFDDFFDTPGRSVDLEPEMTSKKSKGSSFNRSAKKRDRNNSASDSVDRSRVSNDRSASPHYSSDSFTESDSDSTSRKKKSRSRSESSSSRSGGSYSSDSGSSYSRDSRSRSSKAKGSRYSRSRSASTDRSVSRTATPDSARSPKEKPKRKRRDSYSSVTSSSSYSDTRDSERHPPSTKSKDATRRQAWGTEVTITGNKRERPKTAKWRSSDDKVLKEESNRQSRNGKGNYSDSDSDMTDVSPIASPRNSSINGHSREKKIAKPVQYQAMPLGDQEDSERNIQSAGDSSALDLDILMKAVSELEKQKRVKSNTRRVMFEPLRARPIDKSNYTFSNDDTHRIEQENKRLLRQIMRQVQTPEVRKPRASDVRVKQSVLTPSAINRRRAQQKIENENLVSKSFTYWCVICVWFT